jgi:hypothetical protein
MRMGVGGLIADALIVLEKKRRRKIKDSMISQSERRVEKFVDLYTGPGTMREPAKSSGKFWISVDSLWKFGICIFKTPRRRVRTGRGKFEPF